MRLLMPGLVLATAIAVIAAVVGEVVPLVGSAVPAVVLGIAFSLWRKPGVVLRPGIGFAGRRVLQAAVVVLGFRLSLREVARVGVHTFPVLVGTLAICLLAAYVVGRAMGVDDDLRTLVGVGTGICGASAIGAVAPVIGAASADVAYAVSTIFLFNLTAVIVFPLIGHLLGMGQHAFGLFAGTAVNDTSSVVAAATAYGKVASNDAVVVKLVRTLAIVPIVLALALRRGGPDERSLLRRVPTLVPWFLVGFLVAAAINSTGVLPGSWSGPIGWVATFLITVAFAGIGLGADLGAVARSGARPLLLGGVLWVVVSASSLGLQALTTGLS